MPPQLRIRLENVSLDFPVHPYTNRSIKDWLWRTVKGGLGSGAVERFRALHEVSLELSDGDCLGVVGHNGSGKSSLLRVIAGIYRPDAGRVWVRGRLCSLLSLGAGFEPEMPGRDNIYLNGLLLGIPRGEIADRVDWIIEFSGLGEFIDRPVKTYSTGMAARLGFAIACCLQPEVLMLDEVFSVGDAAFIARAERAMKRLLAGSACGVLVSHDPGLLAKHCNKILYLRRGRVVDLGPADKVLPAYLADVEAAAARDAVTGPALPA